MIDSGEGLKQIPLEHPTKESILIPIPEHPPHVDSDNATAWIGESVDDQQMKAIKEKVVANIQHIGFDEFRENLDKSIDNFNEMINQDNSPFWVLWDAGPHKSRRWVYHLSEDRLTRKPTAAVYFSVLNEKRDRRILQKAVEQDIKSFVIFDDASYGGSQIGHDIEVVVRLYREMGHPAPQFFLVVPYITNRAKDYISQIEETRVTWFNSQVILSLGEQLSEEELTYAQQHHFQFTPYGYYTPRSFDRVITFFDHSVPDMRSFDMQVGEFIDRNGFIRPYADPDKPFYEYEEGEYDKYLSSYGK